jgi:hypothetical protein
VKLSVCRYEIWRSMKLSLQEQKNKEMKVRKKNYLNIVLYLLDTSCLSESGKKINRSDGNRKYIK